MGTPNRENIDVKKLPF